MSNFRGYLLKVGAYTVPNSLIMLKGYKGKPNKTYENAERDNASTLHMDYVADIPKAEITLMPMDENTRAELFDNINANYVDADLRKAYVSAWIPEYGRYYDGYMYMSEPDFTILEIDGLNIQYDKTKLSFVSFAED